jgi:hypothetical protein
VRNKFSPNSKSLKDGVSGLNKSLIMRQPVGVSNRVVSQNFPVTSLVRSPGGNVQINDMALCGQFIYAIGTDSSSTYKTAFVMMAIAYPSSSASAYSPATAVWTWSETNNHITGQKITCSSLAQSVYVAGSVGQRILYFRSLDPLSGKVMNEKRIYDATIDSMVTNDNITLVLGMWYSQLWKLPDTTGSSTFVAQFSTPTFPTLAPTWATYLTPGNFTPGRYGESLNTDGLGNVLVVGINTTTSGNPFILRLSAATGSINKQFTFPEHTGAFQCPVISATVSGFFFSCNYKNLPPQLLQYSPCGDCKAGTYSDGTTSCINCPAGTYGTYDGAQDIFACFECLQGTYNNNTGSSSDTDCVSCPAGTYGNTTGASSVQNCVPCPSGTYSDTTGETASSTCKTCTTNSYNPIPGAATCLPCPSRTVPSADFTRCVACSEGYYAGAFGCDVCPTGQYCPVGSILTNVQASFVQRSPPSLTQLSYTDVRNSKSDTNVSILIGLLIGITCAAGVVLGLIALAVCYGLSRKFKPSTIAKIDLFFSQKHDTPNDSPIISRKTALGGVISSVTIIAIIVVLLILIYLFAVKNSMFTETETTDKIIFPTGGHSISVTFFSQDTTCSGNVSVTGIDGKLEDQTYAITGITDNAGGNGCKCSWTCTSCTLTGAEVIFTASLNTPAVSAMALSYNASVPYYDGTSYLLASAPIFAPAGSVFRGATPTTIQVESHPTKFTVLSNPIFTSVNLKVQDVLKLIHIGYSRGSLATATNYNDLPNVLSASVVITSSALTTSVVETQQTPFQTLLINLLNYAGTVIGVVAMVFPKLEFIQEKIKSKQEVKKTPVEVISPTSDEEKDHELQENVEAIDEGRYVGAETAGDGVTSGNNLTYV